MVDLEASADPTKGCLGHLHPSRQPPPLPLPLPSEASSDAIRPWAHARTDRPTSVSRRDGLIDPPKRARPSEPARTAGKPEVEEAP
jgi:hypothetical protein